jgi:hypothetical protein
MRKSKYAKRYSQIKPFGPHYFTAEADGIYIEKLMVGIKNPKINKMKIKTEAMMSKGPMKLTSVSTRPVVSFIMVSLVKLGLSPRIIKVLTGSLASDL